MDVKFIYLVLSTNFGPVWLIDTLVLRILLLFQPIVTNQLARSVSFKDRLIRRNVRVIDSWLLLSLPAGGGMRRHLSLVANTQYCADRLGVMERLVSGYSLPPRPLQPHPYRIVDHMGLARGGWQSAIVLWSPCVVRPFNSCRICSDARTIGLFITATISGLPKCRHVITIEYKCIPRQ